MSEGKKPEYMVDPQTLAMAQIASMISTYYNALNEQKLPQELAMALVRDYADAIWEVVTTTGVAK